MSMPSLAERLLARVAERPDAEALIFVGESARDKHFSFAEVLAESARFAAPLAAHGIGRGDVVLIALPASPRQVFAFWGALLAGATPSLFPYPQPKGLVEQLRALAQASGARAVLADAETGTWESRIAGRDCPLIDPRPLPASAPLPEPAGVDASDIAYMQFTSGTTGRSKGVMLSHSAVLSFAAAATKALSLRDGDISVNWMPLYHDFGLFMGLVTPLLHGLPAVLMSPLTWVRRPAALFAAIHRHRGTLTWSSNAAYLHAAHKVRDEDLNDVDLSSLRGWIAGGEPVLYDCQQAFYKRFARYGLREDAMLAGYGMAENTLSVSVARPGRRGSVDWVDSGALTQHGRAEPLERTDPRSRPVVSSGPVLPSTEVRIVDADSRTLNERRLGNIEVRTPSLFTGYNGHPELTARVLGKDGWYHTGDSGYLADGELYVFGRRDDLIKQAGHGIHPQDIEAIAEVLPEVRHGRTAAFGVPDEHLGSDRIVLACDLAPGVRETDHPRIEREIRRRVYAELQIALRDVLLSHRGGGVVRTANGKLSRGASREKYLQQHQNQSAAPISTNAREALTSRPFQPMKTKMPTSLLLINPGSPLTHWFGAEAADFLCRGRFALMADLATATVAALAPEHFDISICDEAIARADLETTVDYVAITGKSTQSQRMIELAKAYRDRGRTVIIGGPLASLCPDALREHCDILVIGELEGIAERFFADLETGEWEREYRGDVPDLSKSPIPRWDLYPNDGAMLGSLQTSRGCPFTCEFCDVIAYVGRKQRHKAPGQVLAELDVLYDKGYREVFLADDNLTVYRRRAKDLLRAIADWNHRRESGHVLFSTQMSVDAARDSEILRLCGKAGLLRANVGIESPIEESMREANKKQNVGVDMVEAVDAFVRHGLSVTSFLLIGFDSDGLDAFEQHYDFASRALAPALFPIAVMAPSATPLFERMRKDGRLVSDEFAGASMQAWETNIQPLGMTRAQLLQGLRWLGNRLFDPDDFGARLVRFAENVGRELDPFETYGFKKPLVRPVDSIAAAVVRQLGRLGPREAVLLDRALKASRSRPASRWHVMSMLFSYMQTRTLYQQTGFWDPALGRAASPFEDWEDPPDSPIGIAPEGAGLIATMPDTVSDSVAGDHAKSVSSRSTRSN